MFGKPVWRHRHAWSTVQGCWVEQGGYIVEGIVLTALITGILVTCWVTVFSYLHVYTVRTIGSNQLGTSTTHKTGVMQVFSDIQSDLRI